MTEHLSQGIKIPYVAWCGQIKAIKKNDVMAKNLANIHGKIQILQI